MKSTAIAFFVFFVCMLLGFTVARSELLNPVTADVNAEVVRMQIQTENQLRLESVAMERQRAQAQQEANIHLSESLASAMFLLSAVVAACILALTAAAIFWMLGGAKRSLRRHSHDSPISQRRPNRSTIAKPGTAQTMRRESILQPEEHF